MADLEPPGGEGKPQGRAEKLFADYIEKAKRGMDLEGFLDLHPAEAESLRALHSLWIAGDLAAVAAPTLSETAEPALSGALRSFADASAHEPKLERIGPYRLVEILGEGGFGVVYRAEQDRPFARTVAVKVVKLGMDTREAIARFEAERQALALMSHPSIAQVYDAGATVTGRPYFVMELIRGEPIHLFCEKRALPLVDRLNLFVQVCDAVAHAHQKGVLHRDLKPSNILVSAHGDTFVPKVIDFGIAKALGKGLTEHTMQTGLGQIIGTPAYMSPEQADLSGVDVDTRSDVYSLGVILYELLTGSPPFDRESFHSKSLDQLLRFIREEDPPRPSARVDRTGRTDSRKLRGDLDWIVLKAMAKDRSRRYGAVTELAADIRRHLSHEPVLAGPPSAVYRLKKLARKHRAALLIFGTPMLVAVGFLVFLIVGRELDYSSLVAEVDLARHAEDLDRARASLAVLVDRFYGRREVLELERAVEGLELDLRSRRSAAILAEGEASWQQYLTDRETVRGLELDWAKKRREQPTYAQPWDRVDELEAHQRLERSRQAVQLSYDTAVGRFQDAIEAAPRGSPAEHHARESFASVHKRMQEIADGQGTVAFGPEFFRRRGAELSPDLFKSPGAQLRIRTQPPGAAVYGFRYVEQEKRLVPIPLAPSPEPASHPLELAAEPRLLVQEVIDASRSPFHPGDVLLALGETPAHVIGDVARALGSVEVGAAVVARIERGGAEMAVPWTPWSSEPRKLENPRDQLGIVFAGFPLEVRESRRLGRTPETGALELWLADGSYLFLIRGDGRAETKVPVRASGKAQDLEVRLLPAAELPGGLVHIPAGPFTIGGDPDAFQGFPLAEVRLPDYLIGRHEVTLREYLEFLNDPIAPLNEQGEASPTEEAASKALQVLARRQRRERVLLDLLPRWDDAGEPLVERKEGRWVLKGTKVQSDLLPAFGLSHFAAAEYAHWLTERRAGGIVTKYRLPQDAEWEKAARGVDRRFFVWGDYPVWCFSWVRRGIQRPEVRLQEVGFVPTDESVYGVRDLTGSVSEHAVGLTSPPYGYMSVRGGNWWDTDEYWGRAATRNGYLPWIASHKLGFRVVGELRPEER